MEMSNTLGPILKKKTKYPNKFEFPNILISNKKSPSRK